jgi:alanyl aminopeptidase
VRGTALDVKETAVLLIGAGGDPRTRDAAWQFLEANFEALAKRLPSDRVQALVGLGAGFCDADHRQKLAAFFEPRASKFIGMPLQLEQTLETIDLCIAQKARQEPSVLKLLN